MIDIAQLREALAPRFIAPEFLVVYEAAKELLTIREAGALIITPDEGKWPRWATYAVSSVHRDGSEILDALRDAMPDGET